MPDSYLAVSRSRRGQRGVSLVELMVSIAIGLFLLLGLATLLANSSRAHQELQKSSIQIENGRYALQLLSEEIHLAGFYGEYAPTAGVTWTLPDPCVPTAASLGWSYAPPPGVTEVPVAIYGYAGATALPSTCTTNVPELLNRKAGTSVLVVRRVETVTDPGPADGTPYLQVSLCNNDADPFVFSATVADLDLRQKDCAATAVARRYVQRLYYLSNCNVCGVGGDNMPTLKMVEMVGGVQTVVPLVEGIEDLRIEYGVDYLPAPTPNTTSDGSPDCNISDPSSTDSAAPPLATEVASCPAGTWTSEVGNWANVMSVRIYLLARNTEPTVGYNDDKTYDLGITTSTPASRDAIDPALNRYKRHVYSTLVRATNVSARREPS